MTNFFVRVGRSLLFVAVACCFLPQLRARKVMPELCSKRSAQLATARTAAEASRWANN